MSVELIHVMRGGMVESIHRGDAVVMTCGGEIIEAVGDPHKRTSWRSSAKPFQVLPFIEAGGMEAYGLTDTDLATMVSSHGGEQEHVEQVAEILRKVGIPEQLLDCGAAEPMCRAAADAILRAGGQYSPLNNPCSGKHSGMLALCQLKGLTPKDYIKAEHPLQQLMLQTVAEMTDQAPGDIDVAIDGCGVPVFGMPISRMALAYTRLIRYPEAPEKRRQALARIAAAMVSNPFYVAGTGRLDTDLMQVTKGRVLAKLGAEAVYCVSVPHRELAMALKTEDGAYRALDPAILELLRRHECLSAQEYETLCRKRLLPLRNHRGDVIGEMKTVF